MLPDVMTESPPQGQYLATNALLKGACAGSYHSPTKDVAFVAAVSTATEKVVFLAWA